MCTVSVAAAAGVAAAVASAAAVATAASSGIAAAIVAAVTAVAAAAAAAAVFLLSASPSTPPRSCRPRFTLVRPAVVAPSPRITPRRRHCYQLTYWRRLYRRRRSFLVVTLPLLAQSTARLYEMRWMQTAHSEIANLHRRPFLLPPSPLIFAAVAAAAALADTAHAVAAVAAAVVASVADAAAASVATAAVAAVASAAATAATVAVASLLLLPPGRLLLLLARPAPFVPSLTLQRSVVATAAVAPVAPVAAAAAVTDDFAATAAFAAPCCCRSRGRSR